MIRSTSDRHRMDTMKHKVQISIPFTMLYDTYLDRFLTEGLNPEIAIEANALDRFKRDDFIRIADKFHDRALQVTLHGPFIDLAVGSSDKAVRDITRKRLQQMLDLVPVFKPYSVVCHTGFDWRRYGYNPTRWYQSSVHMWSWLAKELSRAGSRLMLENVYETKPEEVLPLLEPLDRLGVGFCLDIGHQASFGGGLPEQWCEVLGPYIGQLHLHDNYGVRDDHLGLGQGIIDFKELLVTVKEHCPQQPVVTLEVHREHELFPSLAYLEVIWPW